MTRTASSLIHLTRHGLSLILDGRGSGLPSVLHWGAGLGELDATDLAALADATSRQSAPGTLDAAWQVTISPQEGDGWSGRPGMQLRRDGILLNPRWRLSAMTATASSAEITAAADAADLALEISIRLDTGLVWMSTRLSNAGTGTVEVDWVEQTLPVPTTTDHLLTFDGRWTREKRPVKTGMPAGSTIRQSRRGRPGHDAPTAFVATESAPAWDGGRSWAVHLAWPADVTYRIDRITDAVTVLGAGELLRPGEIALGPGETYAAPVAAFAFSAAGLDGIAAAFHSWLRTRPQHPRSPRPLTLNTWEAVYFNHEADRIGRLAERAASVGVERFVLDDGWFPRRRDDAAGLGDWTVDRKVWPDGLRPLADRVHALGMQFGLWFEPEMINLDSDLYRANPDWLLHDAAHLDHDANLSWRTQYVLDLANPDAAAHVREQMSELIDELAIDYIKWDHNRDLVEAWHAGGPGVHAHTVAVLALIAELKRRHPGLEIESCSSGGARTDLGILEVTDRVWASDSNDPVERQDIQRWTGLLLPPELIGAHIGPADSHSSGRRTSLSYRAATSLIGHAGFEWDLLACSDEELATVANFAALYKELRPLIHTGRVVHPTLRDPAWRITGVIGQHEAVYIAATVASLEDARPERLRLTDLDPHRRYRVRVRRELGVAEHGGITPAWLRDEITVRGSVLAEVGLQLPLLWPAQALVLHVTEA